jgi:CRISPR-associated endonuclease/helicase Cas3
LARYKWSEKQTSLLVGLHDIGKSDAAFQYQALAFASEIEEAGYPRPSKGDTRCRHERLSARFIRNKLNKAGLNPFVSSAIARAALAHHGYWYEGARDVGQDYARAQDEFCRMLERVLDVETLPKEVPLDLSAFGMCLAGHIVLCDWIASNEAFFTDSRLKDIQIPNEYFAKAKVVARDWICKLGLERNTASGKASCIVEVARPIQKALLEIKNDIPPGLVIIEAPMGEGKTEAAWILAERWRSQGYHGMYMALPTMATSDSLHGRYRDKYLKKLGREEDTKLVHGMAWLRDEKEFEKQPEVGEPGDDGSLMAAWFRPTRRAMLAAHGVGTVDQAMLAGMHVKFGFLRLFGLTDRVLVIDEVHAYDAYMSAIIARLLQWCACLKIPVILLSATLSAKQRAAMLEAYGATGGDPGPQAAYPLITMAEPGKKARPPITSDASSCRTLKIQLHMDLFGDAKKTASKAEELVKDGGCCCVILNTVKQAQAVYKALKLEKKEKLLFHARFTAADRKRIAAEVSKYFGPDTSARPKKFVLVATQVVEQSLDADFDHMISEIAPIDLLLQRSGRLHRHRSRTFNPTLHVLLPKQDGNKQPKFGASEIIYQPYPLLRTFDLLNTSQNSEIKLPEQFRSLIEAVYGANASEDLKDAKQEWDNLHEDMAAQAGEFLLCEPMADDFDPVGADEVGDDSDDGNGWRARTRLGLEDVLAIPVELDEMPGLVNGDLKKDKVKDLYLQSVKIPSHYWPPKPAKGYDKSVLGEKKLRGVWLLPIKKTGDGGWTWEGSREDGKPYKIEYNPAIGLTHGGDK